MSPEQFCYWLKGYFDIREPTEIPEFDVNKIREYLEKVLEENSEKNHKIKHHRGYEIYDGSK